MTPKEALEQIRGYALAGRINMTAHAERRMRERGLRFNEVRSALASASSCTWQADGANWRVEAQDLDGDELTIIAALEDGVLVITLF